MTLTTLSEPYKDWTKKRCIIGIHSEKYTFTKHRRIVKCEHCNKRLN